MTTVERDRDADTRIIVVYNAHGGVTGAVRYLVGKLTRGASCAACTLTHGTLWQRKDWRACVASFPLPIVQTYRDRLTASQRVAAGDAFPCVLLESPACVSKLIGPDDLATCAGDVDRFAEVLEAALRTSRVTWSYSP